MKLTLKSLRTHFNSPEYTPVTLKSLALQLGANDKTSKNELKTLLEEMTGTGEIVRDSRGRYIVPGTNNLTGIIEFTRRGLGAFVIESGGEEIFIPPEETGFAIHGDTVMVEITGDYKDIHRGRVIKVLKRNKTRVVGTFKTRGIFAFVVPDDVKLKNDFYIPPEEFNGAKPDDKVLIKITRYPTPGRNPEGSVERVLGDSSAPEVDLMTVIYRHDLPEPDEFPQEVSAQAKKISPTISERDLKGRKDFRGEVVYTIDGEDAKDFDDAISLIRLENGNYLLGVHIADVSHYVFEGSAIDKEAFSRGTSVYLLDTVIPMLPFELSNNICSLKPDEDRLTLSLIMELDQRGKLLSSKVEQGVIRSTRRLTYTEVNEFLEGKASRDSLEKLEPVSKSLLLSHELASKLRDNRKKRGSVMDISSREVKIIFNDKGRVLDIVPQSRGISEWIIEEFMILANETVAELFNNRGLPFVYRIHEEPDAESMMQLKNYLEALGMNVKIPRNVQPKALQQILEKTKDHPLHTSIERVLVRGMKRAVYSENNIGHFGLASQAYTHFTSPIRRYPDLVVHRLLKAFSSRGNGELTDEQREYEEKLPSIASWASKRERVANEAEWDLLDMKKVEYISNHIGEVFQGVITGLAKFGIFVEITEKMISGLVHISTLDDYYDFIENQNILVGRKNKRIFRIGDDLKVQAVRADKTTMEIDFSIVEKEKKPVKKVSHEQKTRSKKPKKHHK